MSPDTTLWLSNNNNINNTNIITINNHNIIININNNPGTMFNTLTSWKSHYESSPGLFDECRKQQAADRQPPDQANGLGLRVRSLAARVYTHHRHFLLLISPKAENWYLIHCSTESRRLSRPRHYTTRSVRRSLTTEATRALVQAFISCRLDYCNSVLAGVPDVYL